MLANVYISHQISSIVSLMRELMAPIIASHRTTLYAYERESSINIVLDMVIGDMPQEMCFLT